MKSLETMKPMNLRKKTAQFIHSLLPKRISFMFFMPFMV